MSVGSAESGCQNVWMSTKNDVKWMLSILVCSIFSSFHHNISEQLVIFDETDLYHNEAKKKQIHRVAVPGFYRSAKIENPMMAYLQEDQTVYAEYFYNLPCQLIVCVHSKRNYRKNVFFH